MKIVALLTTCTVVHSDTPTPSSELFWFRRLTFWCTRVVEYCDTSVVCAATRLSLLLLSLFVLAVQGRAAEITTEVSATGLTLRVKGLSGDVRPVTVHRSTSPYWALRTPAGRGSADSSRGCDELAWAVRLPRIGTTTAALSVTSWQDVGVGHVVSSEASAQVIRTGSYAGQVIGDVVVVPFRTVGGRLQVADDFVVTVRFTRPLTARSADGNRGTGGPQVLNAAYSDHRRNTPKDNVWPQSDVVQPQSWYVASAPYVRVKTAYDGPAHILASDVLALEPAFAGADLGKLALLRRGSEVALGIIDVDGSATFTERDTLVFYGRRAYGDTTYWDDYDTVCVQYLTLRDGSRLRLTPRTVSVNGQERPSVRRSWRLELDTGLYNLGNGNNGVYYEFNTDRVEHEGFFWVSLRALAHTRSTLPVEVYAAPNGMVNIDLDITSTTNHPVNPDHRVDATVNDSDPKFFVRDGWGKDTIRLQMSASSIPGPTSWVKMFATGTPEGRALDTYFAEEALDGIDITADVVPVLVDGRLTMHVSRSDAESYLSVLGASTDNLYVIDTTSLTFERRSGGRRGTLVSANVTGWGRDWPTEPVTPGARASVRIDNSIVRLDTLTSYTLFYRTESSAVTVAVGAAADQALASLPLGTPVVLVARGGVPPSLLDAILGRLPGADRPTEPSFVLGGVLGRRGVTSQGSTTAGWTSFIEHAEGQTYTVRVGIPAGSDPTLAVADARGWERARLERAAFTNLSATTQQAQYVIITHASLQQQAEQLAQHRARHSNVSTMVVDVASVIDEFGAGRRSPFAIRDWLRHLYTTSTVQPQWLVLVGNASWDPRLAAPNGNVGSERPDLVPTYGRPSSDYWFGLLDDPNDAIIPELQVGRIPAVDATEAQNHIDKIIYADTTSFETWMRRWLFVGGGSESEGLCDIYNDLLTDPFGTGITFTDAPICLDTTTLCKYQAGIAPGFQLRRTLSDGVQWMNFIGHGATTVFDIEGWNAPDLTNEGRYGILATYACQTGSFSNPSQRCKNADYLVEADKGFAGAIGGTGWEFIENVNALHFANHFAVRDGLRNLGDIVYAAKYSLASRGTRDGLNTAYQYSILGDPLTRLRIDTVPQLYVRNRDVVVTDEDGNEVLTSEAEKFVVTAVVRNAGTATEEPFIVRVVFTVAGQTDSIDVEVPSMCTDNVIRTEFLAKGRTGRATVRVLVDPYRITGDDESDNQLTRSYDVVDRTLLPVKPLAFGPIDPSNVRIRVLDPMGNRPSAIAQFVIATSNNVASAIRLSSESEVRRSGSVIDWTPGSVELDSETTYWLGAWTDDGASRSATMWIRIYAHPSATDTLERARIPAEAFTIDDTTSADVVNGVWRFRTTNVPIYIQSSGRQFEGQDDDPTMLFRVGDVPYVATPWQRGMNVFLIGPHDATPIIRWYDTWQFPQAAGRPEMFGTARECYTFLRDSVPTGYRLILGTSDESVTGFISEGLFDSLVIVLKEFGATLADSLRANSSYVLIGQRGIGDGMALEAIKQFPDFMVRVDTVLTIRDSVAVLESPETGIARSILSVQLPQPSAGASVVVYGRTTEGTESVVATLTSSEPTVTWPNGANIRSVRFVAELQADRDGSLGDIVLTYDPADEYLVESDAVVLSTNNLLRGDTLTAVTTVRNVRPDRPAVDVPVAVMIRSATVSTPVFRVDSVTDVETDGTRMSTWLLPTTNAEPTSLVTVTLDPERRKRQLYTLNDVAQATFTVYNDTVTPLLDVFVDNRRVVDGDYVLMEPFFDIRLRDSSRLPVTSPDNLTIFINGVRIRSATSSDFVFHPSATAVQETGDNLARAVARFSFPLELGQNNLLIRAEDASGNRVEHLIALWTTNRPELRGVDVAPNPSNGPVTFRFTLRDSAATRSAVLDIYDVQGRKIDQLPVELTIGSGAVTWNGRGQGGTSLPTGIYVWRLAATDSSGGFLSSVSGTLSIVR